MVYRLCATMADMDTSTNHELRIRHTLLSLLTFGLWLATVLLGFWAVSLIQQAADALVTAYIVQEVESQQLGVPRGGGLRSIVNYAAIAIAVLIWIATVVIAGMDYHFKRVGERRSYRLFAWTFAIEFAIIAVCSLLKGI